MTYIEALEHSERRWQWFVDNSAHPRDDNPEEGCTLCHRHWDTRTDAPACKNCFLNKAGVCGDIYSENIETTYWKWVRYSYKTSTKEVIAARVQLAEEILRVIQKELKKCRDQEHTKE